MSMPGLSGFITRLKESGGLERRPPEVVLRKDAVLRAQSELDEARRALFAVISRYVTDAPGLTRVLDHINAARRELGG